MTTSLAEKGKQAADHVPTTCLPRDLSHKGMLEDLQRVRRTPLVVAPVKNSSGVERSIYNGLVRA